MIRRFAVILVALALMQAWPTRSLADDLERRIVIVDPTALGDVGAEFHFSDGLAKIVQTPLRTEFLAFFSAGENTALAPIGRLNVDRVEVVDKVRLAAERDFENSTSIWTKIRSAFSSAAQQRHRKELEEYQESKVINSQSDRNELLRDFIGLTLVKVKQAAQEPNERDILYSISVALREYCSEGQSCRMYVFSRGKDRRTKSFLTDKSIDPVRLADTHSNYMRQNILGAEFKANAPIHLWGLGSAAEFERSPNIQGIVVKYFEVSFGGLTSGRVRVSTSID